MGKSSPRWLRYEEQMVWISLIDFAQSLDKKPDMHKVPIKGQACFTAPSPLIKKIRPHINSEANLVSELLSFILSPTNKAHGEPVKLSSALYQNSAVPLGFSTLQGFFYEAIPKDDLSCHAN
ncbi:hypothetical protein H920_07034 [Fukomys damarensis]|uniref:Uncharacterized protein n=1 Tax=Fukomys damarensis TaxID=885580 RepID=A0A091DML3_FUKDA|nr:hypothetical protein H920_07034 [Fukomys damarensis]